MTRPGAPRAGERGPLRPSRASVRIVAPLAILLLLAPTLPGVALPSAAAGNDLLLRGTVVTMDDAGTVLADGRVLVRGERIAAVWSGPLAPPGVDVAGARELDLGPDALIFPGLVNLHGHPSYHVLPTWLPPSSHAQPDAGRPSGTEPYANRYQWNKPGISPPEYRRLVVNPHAILRSTLGDGPDMVKYAEVMSALGGQTTFQGDGISFPETDYTLVRNVDQNAFCRFGETCPDNVRSRVNDIDEVEWTQCAPPLPSVFPECANLAVLAQESDGSVDAFLVHLAEGARDRDRRPGDNESARAELLHLASLGLLTEQTVILHGNALEAEDFLLLRAAPSARLGAPGDGRGARIVWAPSSNLALYGDTLHVYDALRAGVLVSLGTDWTPSGTRTLLDEMKVADVALRDPRILGDERFLLPGHVATPREERALDEQIVRMATSNPAKAVRASDKIGSIEAGKLADILVVRSPARSPTGGMPDSPYRRLIDATARDVRLVLVGGEPIAGDVDLMELLKPGDHEVVESPRGGYRKAVDVTNATVPNGTRTLGEIQARLAADLRALGGDAPPEGGGLADDANTYSELQARMDRGAHANETPAEFLAMMKRRFGEVDGRLNLEAIALEPLLAEDDHLRFAALGNILGEDGLLADPEPPYELYRANANHVAPAGNPYAESAFEQRWYG